MLALTTLISETLSNNRYTNDDLNSLLPYGENIRPLLAASTLSDTDLKFLLQKRGVYVKTPQRNNTVPLIASTLLSPKEFEILKNRQQHKDSNIKRSTAQAEWTGEKITVADALSQNLEESIKTLILDDSPFKLANYNIQYVDHDTVIIEGEIERNDWTKNVFSITSHHQWKLTVHKLPDSNIIEYIAETTVPETKEFLNTLQKSVHKGLQTSKVVSPTKTIQKILATHFKANRYIFEFLYEFTKMKFDCLDFKRIVDVETGLDNRQPFPDNFNWLKGNIGELRLTALQGKKLEKTDIVKAGNLGVLVFGEIDAEYSFKFKEANGTCVIEYGFPKFFSKRSDVEFETKIQRIELGNDCAHVAKESVKRYLLAEFQKEKHKLFESFKKENKVDAEPKDINNQYSMTF